ncbi:MAG: carbonate dehydratase [Cellvibrionaceae bacterium]
MDSPQDLLRFNQEWAENTKAKDSEYFNRLSQQQTPDYLWIGCSDSRIAANEIVGMEPGSIFVHRNIANVVVHTDLNCLSVIQYAVEVLKVKHIVVVGHYGCGGVQAALGEANNGLIDNWLEHIRDVYRKHQTAVDSATTEKERANRLCELNVIAQVGNVADTTIVRNAWKAGQDLTLHGWIYSLEDGIVRDLSVTRDSSSLR